MKLLLISRRTASWSIVTCPPATEVETDEVDVQRKHRWNLMFFDIINYDLDRPRSIYQYSYIVPRLSGQNCKYFNFICVSIPKRDLDTKKTTLGVRIWLVHLIPLWIPLRPDFFFHGGFNFTAAKVMCITAMINQFISISAVQIYALLYIHF